MKKDEHSVPCRRRQWEEDIQEVRTGEKGQERAGAGAGGMEKRKQDGWWVAESWSRRDRA